MDRMDAKSGMPRASRRPSNRLAWWLGGLAVVAACFTVRHFWGASGVEAKDPIANPAATGRAPVAAPAAISPAAANTKTLEIVANVNGEEIQRQQLAQECLRLYGKEVLESLMNKYLIAEFCQKQGITISNKEVDDEINRL